MKPFTLVLLLLGLTACGGNSKPKPPTPPPPPVEEVGRPSAPIGTQLERVVDGKFTIPLVGAIACWPPDNGDGKPPASFEAFGALIPYDWPSFSPEWANLVKSKGFNGVLVRIGPSYDSDVCCGLPSGEQSKPYWDLTHKSMRQATKNDQVVLVSVGWDGWQWKHQKAGDNVRLAAPENEVMAGMTIPASPALVKNVNDVVFETCNYMNVIYEISNESSLGPRWTPEWERQMYGLIRQAEQQPGCGNIVHLIGSNTDDVDGPYDFMIYHNLSTGAVPANGKPVMVNEYNPHLTPATLAAKIQEFKAAGQSFWYWRSDAEQDVFEQSLQVLTNTSELFQCPDPKPDRNAFTFAINCDALYGGSCDATPVTVQTCAYCDAIGMGHYGEAIRCGCPMRNEGDPNRLNCEQYVMQAAAPLWFSDGTITFVDANHFRISTTGTWVEACDSTGAHCARKVVR